MLWFNNPSKEFVSYLKYIDKYLSQAHYTSNVVKNKQTKQSLEIFHDQKVVKFVDFLWKKVKKVYMYILLYTLVPFILHITQGFLLRNGDENLCQIFSILIIIFAIPLVLIEIIQIKMFKIKYLRELSNYFDILAIISYYISSLVL